MATMVRSMALEGIEGFPVEIEAATIRGQQQMISIIGLGDQAVKEAGERMQAAMTCYGYDLPKDKTLISLAPGNRRKRGSHYDLGMTLALLAETEQIAARNIDQYVFIGELSLDGRIRPCTKILKEHSEKYGYSARVIHKLLRMARTAADVRGSADIEKEDIIKVLGCRELDKSNSQMYTV